MYEITLPGYHFRYESRKVAVEVFEALCTTYEHDARISLSKDGKEIMYALIDKDLANFQIMKVR